MAKTYSTDDLRLALDLSAEHVKALTYSPPTARTVLVLTAAASHVSQVFGHLPRVHITGEYGSGKSTLLSAVQPLVQNPVRNAGQLTTTFAYRNDFRDANPNGSPAEVPVTMTDETKHIYGENGKKGRQHPLYAIQTEGYSKTGAPIKFQEDGVNQAYPTFQVAISASRGISALPEDVVERAIVLTVTKKPEGMALAKTDDPSVAANGKQIGQFLRTAVQAVREPLKVMGRETDFYEKYGMDNRDADKWAALFTVAELAGAPWPQLVASAYAELGSKTARNLPTQFQLKVDVLSYLEASGHSPDKIPARDLIEHLTELGRAAYMWDDAPFTLKRFGLELRAVGVHAHRMTAGMFYRVSDDWLKAADRIANPVMVEAEDPENDWSVLEDFIE